ncbi:MAG: hypothetical protein ACRD4P_02000, partial [Bryobacteraceae bacterium]
MFLHITSEFRRVWTVIGVGLVCLASWTAKAEPCTVIRSDQEVEIRSLKFAFRLSTANGLHAESWTNRMTGLRITLGSGPEIEFDIGLPGQPLRTPRLRIVKIPNAGTVDEVIFDLTADEPRANVTVRYVCDASHGVLRKFVTITNAGSAEWDRLLNVRLGTYRTNVTGNDADPDFPVLLTSDPHTTSLALYQDPAGRERGFPAYLAREFFLSLAHPAGWSTRDGSNVSLRQYPGTKLSPGQSFDSMEAVYGVSSSGQARAAFRTYLATRMRRVVHGHNKPYAIFESLGGWSEAGRDEDHLFLGKEKPMLDILHKVAEGDRDSGCHFDFFSMEFWHDVHGDFKHADPERFPHDLTPILKELREIGTSPGLWVDSGGAAGWTIGKNPAIQNAYTLGPGKGGICRADKTVNRLYTEGFLYQIQHNGVKLLKFDNFGWPTFFLDPECNNPKHEHLPGLYSTEAIENGAISFYRALQSQDVFIMLYWGYRSPWWLRYADTLFDAGTRIEGASFTAFPAPYGRDSTIRRLDQARWILKDVPPLGWDTLGVWLADWKWNSRIGKARWQNGVVMDICRGNLLAQIWADPGWLTPPERKQMANFIALLKGGADRFRNCRFIYGNPWKDQAYGYVCSDGRRAFVTVNNGVWRDNQFQLDLGHDWGLPDGKTWDVYRWYPEPAKLRAEDGHPFRRSASLALRPFDVTLLEVVPSGESPTLPVALREQRIRTSFAGASRAIPLSVSEAKVGGSPGSRVFSLHGKCPASKRGGLVTLTVELRDGEQQYWVRDQEKHFSAVAKMAGAEITPEPALKEGYPSPWQTWRIEVPSSGSDKPLESTINTS